MLFVSLRLARGVRRQAEHEPSSTGLARLKMHLDPLPPLPVGRVRNSMRAAAAPNRSTTDVGGSSYRPEP